MGDSTAQYRLGYCYENGQGVPQDYAEAFNWYLKASDDLVEAQFAVALKYSSGIGVKRSKRKAFFWDKVAAEQDCVESMAFVSQCCYKGEGVFPSRRKAAEWALAAIINEYDGFTPSYLKEINYEGYTRKIIAEGYWDEDEVSKLLSMIP